MLIKSAALSVILPSPSPNPNSQSSIPKPQPMPAKQNYHAKGGCDCGAIRYRLEMPPLFVNCCHCRCCQRQSGAAFALNASIETHCVTRLNTDLGVAPEAVEMATASGKGQRIMRCPKCRTAVWSHYLAIGALISFIRVGTLDEPDRLPPDMHLYTESKQPWVVLPKNVRSVARYYDRHQCWSQSSLARWRALFG